MYRSIAIIIGLGIGAWALPASAKPSTFQQSCTGSKLTTTPEKVVLKASCKKKDGTPVPASIEITGIANMPAGLTRTNEPHSSFQNSCSAIKVVAVTSSVKITAVCQDGRGGTRNGSIAVDDIENIDGVLKIIR